MGLKFKGKYLPLDETNRLKEIATLKFRTIIINIKNVVRKEQNTQINPVT
jgi:hypothetical protein